MKYKLSEGSTIYLAGVANYNTSNKEAKDKGPKVKTIEFDFTNDLDIDTDALKEELKKIKIIAKDEAKKAVENIKVYAKQYKTSVKPEETEETEDKSTSETESGEHVENEYTGDHTHTEPQEEAQEGTDSREPSADDIDDKKTTYNEPDFMDGFTEAMKNFGSHMEHFGKNLEKNLSKNMGTWAKSFEKGMDHFEKNMEKFGEEMERFGEEMGKKGEVWGENLEENLKNISKNFEKHWSQDNSQDAYESWELEALFNELYKNSEIIQELDPTPDRFFKVENYELGTKLNDQMTFVGCQVKSIDALPNQFVSQSLKADKWLIVKLTKEEYNKDWMSKLTELDEVKDYTMESYFIVRQFKKQEVQDSKKIKLYIPLKEK